MQFHIPIFSSLPPLTSGDLVWKLKGSWSQGSSKDGRGEGRLQWRLIHCSVVFCFALQMFCVVLYFNVFCIALYWRLICRLRLLSTSVCANVQTDSISIVLIIIFNNPSHPFNQNYLYFCETPSVVEMNWKRGKIEIETQFSGSSSGSSTSGQRRLEPGPASTFFLTKHKVAQSFIFSSS